MSTQHLHTKFSKIILIQFLTEPGAGQANMYMTVFFYGAIHVLTYH